MKSRNAKASIHPIGKLLIRLVVYSCPLIAVQATETEAASEICCDNSCLPGLDQRFLNYCNSGLIKPTGTYFCPDNTARILELISEYNRLEQEGCVSDDCLRRLYEINEEIARLVAEGRNCQETTSPPDRWIDFAQLMTECRESVVQAHSRYRKYCLGSSQHRDR